MDRLEEIKNELEARGAVFGGDTEWLIQEVERLRAARIADLNELAEGFELTSRSSTDGIVFRHCARTIQDKITEIELGAIDV